MDFCRSLDLRIKSLSVINLINKNRKLEGLFKQFLSVFQFTMKSQVLKDNLKMLQKLQHHASVNPLKSKQKHLMRAKKIVPQFSFKTQQQTSHNTHEFILNQNKVSFTLKIFFSLIVFVRTHLTSDI